MIPFYYYNTDYSASEVKKVNNWHFGYKENEPCDGEEVACAICVDIDFTELDGAGNPKLKDDFIIVTGGTDVEANVVGSSDDDMISKNKDL